LVHHINRELRAIDLGHRETDTVDRDRVTEPRVGSNRRTTHRDSRVMLALGNVDDLAEFRNYTGEHRIASRSLRSADATLLTPMVDPARLPWCTPCVSPRFRYTSQIASIRRFPPSRL